MPVAAPFHVPAPDDEVGSTVADQAHHLGNLLRRVTQVGVHQNDDVASGKAKAIDDRRRQSRLAEPHSRRDAMSFRLQTLHRIFDPAPGVVIDDHHLPRDSRRRRRRADLSHENRDALGILVGRNDHGHEGLGHGGPSTAVRLPAHRERTARLPRTSIRVMYRAHREVETGCYASSQGKPTAGRFPMRSGRWPSATAAMRLDSFASRPGDGAWLCP